MDRAEPDDLLRDATLGNPRARQELLMLHWERLRHAVAGRMSQRLARRLDPSDIVNATLAVADRRLDAYLTNRSMPFYPWLRQLARDELIAAYRKHVVAGCRSVLLEDPRGLSTESGSTVHLVELLVDDATSVAGRIERAEEVRRMTDGLGKLAGIHQEILVLHYQEGLTIAEAAEVLGVGESTARMRHLRALQQIRLLMTASEMRAEP